MLGLIASHPVGQRIARDLAALYLLDQSPEAPAKAPVGIPLPDRAIDPAALLPLLCEHRIDQVIEAADVDTLGCARACAEAGADYLSTSLQSDACGKEGAQPSMIASQVLVPGRRPELAGSHLIGSGMNPGIANALARAGIEELARRVGASSDAVAADLDAIYVTERDTTAHAAIPPAEDVFEMSWSPRHCLEELLEPEAMASRDGQVVSLGHRPTERWYIARCGAEEIKALAVPHEEVVTLGEFYPFTECAFLYSIPQAARRALLRNPQRAPGAWRTRALYPPHEHDLSGTDRVGTLLCSRHHGELWIGFDTPVEAGLRHGTNGTQLQVAAGVLAGWMQLGARRGVHVVEELDWRAYLDVAEAILGPAQVHHAPDAPPRRLHDRVVA